MEDKSYIIQNNHNINVNIKYSANNKSNSYVPVILRILSLKCLQDYRYQNDKSHPCLSM